MLPLDKLLNDVRFLSDVKKAALDHKDDVIPNNDSSVYQSMMWARGTVDTLSSRGYKIVKEADHV